VTVRFLATAEREFERRILLIAAKNPDAAHALVSHVSEVFDPIDTGVEGTAVTLRNGRTVRRWPVPPLVIFYDRRGTDVIVVRVRHASQRPL
jgi:plasmid stabilization system protein ParE